MKQRQTNNGSLRKRETMQPQQHTEYYLFNSQGNLKAYSDDVMSFAYYGYNAANTRTYKLSLYNTNLWINGQQQPLHLQLQQAMFYPNTYINFNQNGEYTKHYYNGTERVASRLGDNTTTIAINNNILEDRKLQLEEQFRVDIHKLIYETVPIDMPPFMDVNALQPTGTPNDIYYYHPNHLGSTAFVTDNNATITQGFLYAPFGEVTTEYNVNFGNNTIPKYSFNAKELDEETGMYYYEARYYAPPTFISRDPLMSEKPWLTPYHYCSNNPVGRVDPSGCEDEVLPYLIFNGKTNKIQIWDDGDTPDNYNDDIFIGEYEAHNNVTSDSQGKWEDGIYEMLDKNERHTHGNEKDKRGILKDSPNGSYGKGGNYRAKKFKETTSNKIRENMAVHAGREDRPFFNRKTEGCIRTTPEAMEAIDAAINKYGPLQNIIIQNNRHSLNSENANNIKPRNLPKLLLPLFNLPIHTIPQDKTRVNISYPLIISFSHF
ncbi:MAG: RHS repeat-associated core domain-containing protein [Bacteroidales bacterium]|nr:RHS repeat-associated core domain-containing protein [Bacteroidales bacterium]